MTGGGIERVLSIALAARAARQTPPWLRSSLRSIAPIWPLRLSSPLERRDASGDESPDASLQRAGGAIGAVVRHRRGYGRRLMAPCGHPIHHWQRPQPHSPWLAAATRSTT